MSSAVNHRARSHKSQSRHVSAMSGSGRRTILHEANRFGGRGAPFIYRLQAFHRAILKRRRKSKVEELAEV